MPATAQRLPITKNRRFRPNPARIAIPVHDITPGLVLRHTRTEKLRVLAKVRYNRLIDLFLRATAYSLQNHLRTTVPDMGQIETDEVYVAVRNTGKQYVVPVQAKGGKDQIGSIQVRQDLAMCRRKFPALVARPVAVQYVREGEIVLIAMFELADVDGRIGAVDEKHYRLVPAGEITADDLGRYGEG